jgi:hypothetical protein
MDGWARAPGTNLGALFFNLLRESPRAKRSLVDHVKN